MAAISYSTYTGGGRISAVLSQALHVNLYDPVGLRRLITQQPYLAGGSATQNVTTITRGNVMAAAASETSGGFTAEAPTGSQYQLTVARYGLVMQPTDLFRITQPGAPLDVDFFLGMLTESLDLTLTDLITALFPNISSSVGTSGGDATVDDVYDGIFTLNLANNAGMIAAVLHNQQINDVMASIRVEGGALEQRADTQAAVAAAVNRRSDGFRFSFAGVDFIQCDSVATADAGANRDGCMFTEGAFAYTLGSVSQLDPMIDTDDIVVGTDEMFVERDRSASNGTTDFVVNAYPGTAEAEDSRAVRFKTDA